MADNAVMGVKELYLCFLFKRITTDDEVTICEDLVSKNCIYVSFLSESQPGGRVEEVEAWCQRTVSMFPF